MGAAVCGEGEIARGVTFDVGSTKISRWYLRSASNLASARANASSCEPPGRPRLVGRLRRRPPLAMRVSSCADHASTLYITCVEREEGEWCVRAV